MAIMIVYLLKYGGRDIGKMGGYKYSSKAAFSKLILGSYFLFTFYNLNRNKLTKYKYIVIIVYYY